MVMALRGTAAASHMSNKGMITVDPTSFPSMVKKWAAATGLNISDAAKQQWRLYHAELINRTPPFSGRLISKMLIARGKGPLSDPDIEKATAKKVGENAVARDMRKLFLAVKNWRAAVRVKNWVKLFVSAGAAWGVPESFYNPSPSRSWMEQVRGKYRDNRGRINYKGQVRNGAQSVTVMKYPVPELQYEMLEKKLKADVGRARAGWANGFVACGGRMGGGWVGKWLGKTGSSRADFSKPWNAQCETVNSSEWAEGGDPDRIRQQAMGARERMLEKAIEFALKEKWG